jgi:hypothetical protein
MQATNGSDGGATTPRESGVEDRMRAEVWRIRQALARAMRDGRSPTFGHVS